MTTFELFAGLIVLSAFAYTLVRSVLDRSVAAKSPGELTGYRSDKRGSLSSALTLGGVVGLVLTAGALLPYSRDLPTVGAGMWLVGCLLILKAVQSVPTAKRSCANCGQTMEVFRDSSLPQGRFSGQRGYLFVCHHCKTYYSVVTASWGNDA